MTVLVANRQAETRHLWIYRKAVLPFVGLLRMGASPRMLAWGIACGFMIGINPVLGSTTVICLCAALALRLNVVASQAANHLAFPLQLALMIPFLRLASLVFGIPQIPLSPAALVHSARTQPLMLMRQIWVWESRAFVVWLAISIVIVPLLAVALTPVLTKVLERLKRDGLAAIPEL